MGARDIFAKYASKETMDRIVEYDTVAKMWEDKSKEFASDIAIDYDGKQYTYADLSSDVDRFRTVIKNAGLKYGDRVGLLSQNSYDFVVGYLAAVTSGLTVAVLPAHLDEMTVFGCTMKFALKGIIYNDALVEKTVVAKAKGVTLISLSEKSDTVTPSANVKGSDGCVIMFTGGTTGKSKGALLSNTAVMQGTVNGCYGINAVFNERYMLILPLSHVFGLIRNLMTCLYTGSALFICKNNKDMFRDIAIFRPTILVAVPALAEMALNLSKKFGRNMLGTDIKYVICGAATVSPYLINEYDKMGVVLCPGYGLTETANLVSGNPENVKKPSSVGIFYPNQEYKIVDGELWIKGKNLMDCYVGDPEENEKAFEDGYFKTGDLVRVDEDGFLYIVGRSKEIIVLPTGENISPAELEAKFDEIELVQDSQVFEDVADSGERILALEVVPRMTEMAKYGDKAGEKLMEEIRKVNSSFPPFERVVKITVRDSDFARTPSMKIVRYKKCN